MACLIKTIERVSSKLDTIYTTDRSLNSYYNYTIDFPDFDGCWGLYVHKLMDKHTHVFAKYILQFAKNTCFKCKCVNDRDTLLSYVYESVKHNNAEIFRKCIECDSNIVNAVWLRSLLVNSANRDVSNIALDALFPNGPSYEDYCDYAEYLHAYQRHVYRNKYKDRKQDMIAYSEFLLAFYNRISATIHGFI